MANQLIVSALCNHRPHPSGMQYFLIWGLLKVVISQFPRRKLRNEDAFEDAKDLQDTTKCFPDVSPNGGPPPFVRAIINPQISHMCLNLWKTFLFV